MASSVTRRNIRVRRHHIKNWGTSTAHRCHHGDSGSGHFPRRLVLRQSWMVSPSRVTTCWQLRPSIFSLLLVLTLHAHIFPSAQLSMLRLGDRSSHSLEQRRVSHWEILIEFAGCARQLCTQEGSGMNGRNARRSTIDAVRLCATVDHISTPGNHVT
jgi:hypothetical protein